MSTPCGALSWPPPNAVLDFGRDCNAWGAWLSAVVTPDTWSAGSSTLGLNFKQSLILLSRAPTSSSIPPPSFGDAATWWSCSQWLGYDVDQCPFQTYPGYLPPPGLCANYWNAQVNLSELVVKRPALKCQKEMCRALAMTGNPDIVGVGVKVAYYYEATIVTVFFLAYLADTVLKRGRWHRRESAKPTSPADADHVIPRSPPPRAGSIDMIIDVFRHTVKPVFETAAFISISILIAAIYTVVKLGEERRNSMTPAQFLTLPNVHIRPVSAFYDATLALLASLFSIFSVFLLALISDQGHRRSRQRQVIVIVAYALCMALVFLAPGAAPESGGRENLADLCNKVNTTVYIQALLALRVLVFLLPLLWMIGWISIRYKQPSSKQGHFNGGSRPRSLFIVASASIAFISMWVLLGLLSSISGAISDTAGMADESSKVTFGQILASVAWSPTLITMAYVAFCGAKVAYDGEMTVDYNATSAVPELEMRAPADEESHEYTAAHVVR